MDAWVIWLLAACVLAVGEMLIMGFFLAPFALGAFAATVLSAAGAQTVAWVVFAVGTALAFALVRPIARRHLRQPPHTRTGAAALVGRGGQVIDRVDNRAAVGSVRIDGEVWTARSYDDERVLEPGEQVQVVEIRGATALVTEA